MFCKVDCQLRKMTTMVLVMAFIAICIPSACKTTEIKKDEPTMNLRYELSGDSVYVIGETVEIEFSFYNLTDDSLFFLKWYTPFEGIKGKIFEVEFRGEKLPYLGRMIKRGSPVFDDYICIAPGDKIVTRVDLSRSYDFSVLGEYTVDFRGIVDDVRKSVEPDMQLDEPQNRMNISGNQIKFQIRN